MDLVAPTERKSIVVQTDRRDAGQHFLLSSGARTLSLATVARMTEDEARGKFKEIRWADNGGEPYCPRCEHRKIYEFSSRQVWKCADCGHQFSVTSGTIFAGRKMSVRDLLLAIAIFVNSAKGHSALQLSRDLQCAYKTAFVLAHKLREAIAAEQQTIELSGNVEIDGAFFGGYVEHFNKATKNGKILSRRRYGNRRVVVVMKQRDGRTLTVVVKKESEAVFMVRRRVSRGTVIHADSALGWNSLKELYQMLRVDHSKGYSIKGACTNYAESYFSMLRRCSTGVHHRIAGHLLSMYAAEIGWRQDNRRKGNGELWLDLISLALRHSKSQKWVGYSNSSKSKKSAEQMGDEPPWWAEEMADDVGKVIDMPTKPAPTTSPALLIPKSRLMGRR